jgi:predicted DNA-binding transcriptional regulator YafY
MFDLREITALVLGSRMVAAWGDDELASAANDALRKIEAVLTPALRDRIDAVRLYAPATGARTDGPTREMLERLRGAIETSRVIEVAYGDEKGSVTERRLRPMALLFWGQVWTLVAWCELRDDFRSFRVDRFREIHVSEAVFVPEKGQRYEDFLAQIRRQFGDQIDRPRPRPTA